MASLIETARERGGRLFILGVGGSAANASHAVNDFRKIVGIEAYAPTDNVSELTARTNDEGWADDLRGVAAGQPPAARGPDPRALRRRRQPREEHQPEPGHGAAVRQGGRTPVIGIVGKDGGYTAKVADACVIVPTVNPDHVTPHSEAFQAVVWHLLVSHPAAEGAGQTKWESVDERAGPSSSTATAC